MKTLTILLIALLAGCAKEQILVKQNISNEQVSRDNAECHLESMKATIGQSQNLFVELNKKQAFVYCLQAKGYK